MQKLHPSVLCHFCYIGSCIFNQSRKATAFYGGIALWCFIASLPGMFDSEDMMTMGAGVEELGIFNKLPLIGLYDIQSPSTVGTESVNFANINIRVIEFYIQFDIIFYKRNC